MTTRNIKAIIASVEKLHGGSRDQFAKYDNFVAWQIRQRMAANQTSSSVLKVSEDDPHDANVVTVETLGQ